jgi:bacterial/archaeal transporter family-2 protein
MLAALVIDHYGLIGIPRHSADGSRMLGTGLLICGVILIRR